MVEKLTLSMNIMTCKMAPAMVATLHKLLDGSVEICLFTWKCCGFVV